MLVLNIVLIFFAVLFALLLIPVYVSVSYTDSLRFSVRYLFFRLAYPQKKEKKVKKKPERKKGKKEEKKSDKGGILKGQGISGFIDLMKDIAGIGGKTVDYILRNSHVTKFTLSVAVVGEDAAKAAIGCGYFSALVYPAVAWFSTRTRMKNPSVSIRPEYDGKETKAELDVRGWILPWIVVLAALAALFRYILLFVKRRIS